MSGKRGTRNLDHIRKKQRDVESKNLNTNEKNQSRPPKSDFNWEAIRPPWGSPSDLRDHPHVQEVKTEDGKKCFEIAGRLYEEHAIARMMPVYSGTIAGSQGRNDDDKIKQRAVSPRIVEETIRNGSFVRGAKSDGFHERKLGDVVVVISNDLTLVKTVYIQRK